MTELALKRSPAERPPAKHAPAKRAPAKRTFANHSWIFGVMLAMTACAPDDGDDARKPAKFEAAKAQVSLGARIARCNTVHSETLPEEVVRRYNLSVGEDLAFISCSLQIAADPPSNIPARVSGIQTALTGATASLDFKEILEEGAVSYIAPFDLTAASEIRFDVLLVDVDTQAKYELNLRQDEVSGRA
jgi:hypothetical protein